ncbi:MAG TPA: ATP-binding protein [Anaeromyxobacter sp.]
MIRREGEHEAGPVTRGGGAGVAALLAVLAGALLLGWAIHRRLGGGRLGGSQDVGLAVAFLLIAGGIAWSWYWGERARRLAAERDLVAEAFRDRAEIFAALNDAVVATDAEGRITAWSPSAERTYGWTEQEAMGKRASDLLRTEYARGPDQARMTAELARSGRIQCPARQHRKDGSALDVETTVVGRPRPVDVRAVLESALAMAQHEIKHRARVVVDFPAEPLAVDANAARLGQVFLNLLVNAAQAIPEGHADRNEIRLSARAAGARVVLEVFDTGVGIPPEELGRLFDPFFTTKPMGGGTGLGLAICHGIVATLGGEISVASRAGAGTTFTVALPAADARRLALAAERDPSPEEPKPSARRGRVLVIDDEPGIGTAIQRVLRRDHDVVAATSGREALSVIKSASDFDAVLCDVMMPELTGMEIYRVLRAELPELAERVVFMSGGAFTPEARAFLSEVPNRSIAKPFDPTALRAVVARIVGGG